ncbi:RNA-directed DNA polymerase from mobile element jockey [Eumeta japonica]|uniref:RNA-directed DNA polymerase from mobile element jockey n=1 Tax=Eumeta variegata TaxID=151549 RepID=A0A4C1VUD5_EUMVA|nr:RNA-directed DNA polymerase from mobile element jockey [Eumeta japonica]
MYDAISLAIARRAQAAHGTFPERGPGTNSLPYMVRNAGRCSEGSYDGSAANSKALAPTYMRHSAGGDPARQFLLLPKDDLSSVSPDEVQKLIKNQKPRKAPGLDGINNKAIKCFSATLLALLVAIINACIKNGNFPEAWKETVVIGIPKPGKLHNLPTSYRPISLLSRLGKLIEKFLKTKLSGHLLGNGLIINEQFGFRPNHSCPRQASD